MAFGNYSPPVPAGTMQPPHIMQPLPAAQPLGAQVGDWVDHTAAQIPGLNPGMGGPIHGQQVPNTQFPMQPGAAPSTPLPPGPAPAIPLPPTPPVASAPPIPVETPIDTKIHNDPRNNLDPRFQDRMAELQQRNPEGYAHRMNMVRNMMTRRGLSSWRGFTPTPITPAAPII